MALSHFYPPPEPVQQTRYAPIPKQGNQPPRTTPGAFALVAAWYVAAAIPQPVQGTRVITPLTLTYGQQPPRIAPMPKVQEQVVWAAWPPDGEPRLVAPLPRHASDVVPLTLRYGQQPPRQLIRWGDLQSILLTLAPDWPAQAQAKAAAFAGTVLVAPFIPKPPPAIPAAWFVVERTQWRRFTLVDEPILAVVPLAPSAGPAWSGPDWTAQSEADTAAWNVPATASPFVPFRQNPAPWIAVEWAAQTEADSAPLSLVYGQQPPRFSLASLASLIALWPPAGWPAQEGPGCAAWNAPIVSQPPPFRRDPISPLWFEPGRVQWCRYLLVDEPIPSAPPGRAPMLVAWPVLDWSSQSEVDSAAWNFVPPIVSQPTPFRRDPVGQMYLAWGPPAPPPIAAVISGSVLIGGTPLALVATPFGAWPALDWAAQRLPLSTVWVVPPVVSQPSPFRRDPVAQVFLDWLAQRVGPVAPLALVYGQQPPRRAPADVGFALPWFVDWPAQSEADAAAFAGTVLVLPKTGYRRDPVPWTPLEWLAQVAAPTGPFALAYGQQPPRWQRWGAPVVLQGWHVVGWPAQRGGPFPPLGLVLVLAFSYWHHDAVAAAGTEDARSASAGPSVGTEGATPETARTVVVALESYRTVNL